MKFILFISVFFLISCQEIKPECHSGYILENESCVDIDECLNNQVCGNGFYCENLKGSYRCLDIDECSQNSYNCNINALCMNIIGSFICRCKGGFEGDGVNYCEDIDECQKYDIDCGYQYQCVNTIGDYDCIDKCLVGDFTCDDGYRCNNNYGHLSCVDIDECSENLDSCDSSENCINLDGTFVCECKSGFKNNGIFCESDPFITTWKTDNNIFISDRSATIPTIGSGYNYEVDCDNDGDFEAKGITSSYSCYYSTPGIYQISIRGDFPRIYFNFEGDRDKIISIDHWGSIKWESMDKSFYGCSNLELNADDSPDLSNVSSTEKMFAKTHLLNGNLENWNTSNITNMSYMFYQSKLFNGKIDNWNVSNVTNMRGMFYQAESINQNLSTWDVKNVVDCSNFSLYSTNWSEAKPNFIYCIP